MKQNDWTKEFQSLLIEIREDIIKFTRDELSKNIEFQRILGKQISISRIKNFEDDLTKKFLSEYCQGILIFIGADKKGIEDLGNHKNPIEFLKKKWDEKKISLSLSETDYQLFPNLRIATDIFDLKNIDKIQTVIDFYKNHLKANKYRDVIFQHVLDSVKHLAFEKRNQQNKPSFNKTNVIFKYYKKASEKLICFISEWAKNGWHVKVYLTGSDLSYLNLSGPKTNQKKSLKGAWLNNTNLNSTNFSNLNLEDVNFEHVNNLRNSCFKNTILKNASFKGADLRGVNKTTAFNKDLNFIDGMSLKEAGTPFLEAKTLYTRNIDGWLKDFIKQNGKSDLLKKN